VLDNNRIVSKDTEQNLVLVPSAYWHVILKPKPEKLLRKKVAQNRHVPCDDISVTVSVTDRTERDLINRFEDIIIDWSLVEKQFIKWSELFRSGKKLRVSLSFNYTDSYSSSVRTPRRGNKRGSSATQRMLAELDDVTQPHAEHEGSGQAPAWKHVYALMQCPGSPCNSGPYCWRKKTIKTTLCNELIAHSFLHAVLCCAALTAPFRSKIFLHRIVS